MIGQGSDIRQWRGVTRWAATVAALTFTACDRSPTEPDPRPVPASVQLYAVNSQRIPASETWNEGPNRFTRTIRSGTLAFSGDRFTVRIAREFSGGVADTLRLSGSFVQQGDIRVLSYTDGRTESVHVGPRSLYTSALNVMTRGAITLDALEWRW